MEKEPDYPGLTAFLSERPRPKRIEVPFVAQKKAGPGQGNRKQCVSKKKEKIVKQKSTGPCPWRGRNLEFTAKQGPQNRAKDGISGGSVHGGNGGKGSKLAQPKWGGGTAHAFREAPFEGERGIEAREKRRSQRLSRFKGKCQRKGELQYENRFEQTAPVSQTLFGKGHLIEGNKGEEELVEREKFLGEGFAELIEVSPFGMRGENEFMHRGKRGKRMDQKCRKLSPMYSSNLGRGISAEKSAKAKPQRFGAKKTARGKERLHAKSVERATTRGRRKTRLKSVSKTGRQQARKKKKRPWGEREKKELSRNKGCHRWGA